MKVFDRRENCIKDILREISLQYKDKKKFLDFGCGRGDRTVFFDEFDRVLHGVDWVDQLHKEIRPRLHFIQRDFVKQRIEFPDEYFDLAFSFDVIEHLPEPECFLREVYRLLRKGGIFVISTPNRRRALGLVLIGLGLRKFPDAHQGDPAIPYAMHWREYTDSELASLLNKFGFRVIKKRRVFYGWRTGLRECFGLPLYHNIIIECAK